MWTTIHLVFCTWIQTMPSFWASTQAMTNVAQAQQQAAGNKDDPTLQAQVVMQWAWLRQAKQNLKNKGNPEDQGNIPKTRKGNH